MNKTAKIILVTGATGQQGGAVVRHLLARGWNVRALTRDPEKPAAQALRQAGVSVIQGDNEDGASLDAALHDAYGVFSVQNGERSDQETELRQGKNIADAAKSASIQHFVYTSVLGAEAQSGFRRLAKWQIEQYVQALGLPTTIFRPAGFMDDFVGPRFGVSSGQLTTAIKPDVPFQLIATSDIGAFVARAFDQPQDYLGKTIAIAGDALTPPQIASALSKAAGRTIPYVQIPLDVLRQKNADAAAVFQWFNEANYQVDIPGLRSLYPSLMDFATWLEKEGKAKLKGLTRQ